MSYKTVLAVILIILGSSIVSDLPNIIIDFLKVFIYAIASGLLISRFLEDF